MSRATMVGQLSQQSELGAVQPDVRRLVDLINHLLNENRVLREELAVQQLDWQDSDSLGSPEYGQDEFDREPEPIRQPGAVTRTRGTRTLIRHGVIRRMDESPTSVSSSSLARPPEQASEIAHQVAELRVEVQSLRQEVRSIQRFQAITRASAPEQESLSSAPRIEPIQAKRSHVTLESDGNYTMWMKLRQPWFYVPLIWITGLGIIALVSFTFFWLVS